MRLPPQLRVALGPSRIVRAFAVIVAVGCGLVLAALPWPAWAIAPAQVAIVAWAWLQWRSFGPQPWRWVAVEVMLTADRLVVVRTADGRLRAGYVRDLTYVSPSLTAIVWKPDGARWSRTVLVLPDMTPDDDFRRLRILLRYGRSEEAAGLPASQA